MAQKLFRADDLEYLAVELPSFGFRVSQRAAKRARPAVAASRYFN